MSSSDSERLQFIFDQVTKTGIVAMDDRMVTIPGIVKNQKETERLGLELAQRLGWTTKLS